VCNKTVLVVDDSADVRLSLELLLPMFGYTVATAANGQEALDYLHAHEPPCAILLDLRMPVMGGDRFREEQLREPALAGIPVVVVSGEIDLEGRADLGNVVTLGKPADPLALVRLIQERCG
jgi:CheY-like chemotaxis protein